MTAQAQRAKEILAQLDRAMAAGRRAAAAPIVEASGCTDPGCDRCRKGGDRR